MTSSLPAKLPFTSSPPELPLSARSQPQPPHSSSPPPPFPPSAHLSLTTTPHQQPCPHETPGASRPSNPPPSPATHPNSKASSSTWTALSANPKPKCSSTCAPPSPSPHHRHPLPHRLPPRPRPTPAHDTLRAIEARYMDLQVAQPGLVLLIDYLDARALPKAIWTRNWDRPVRALLARFLPGRAFAVVTREWGGEPKPHPGGIYSIARDWGLFSSSGDRGGDSDAIAGAAAAAVPDATNLIMVGDSMDDMLGGRNAGAATVLLLNHHNADVAASGMADLVVRRLDELIPILENGFVGEVDGSPIPVPALLLKSWRNREGE
ncbi:unnamed protein product [Parascedosporium putredinis]|uniref:HAD-like protein n=1 Tax=Parascedosporium putredinis TaxID=1442378 RepID=A0A9P1GYF1_9PEZI|nr:unnamed protein product [Parascedosporium putredinis]CAI7990081.1 unnamed protein product [Parascedosporium putredinis]